MRQKPERHREAADRTVNDIRRKTHKTLRSTAKVALSHTQKAPNSQSSAGIIIRVSRVQVSPPLPFFQLPFAALLRGVP